MERRNMNLSIGKKPVRLEKVWEGGRVVSNYGKATVTFFV
jgi:hypothetical protein